MNFVKPKFWKKNNLIVFILWPLTLFTILINILKKLQIPYKPNIPTICIGNIYLGGTGKTQLVLKINQILKKKYNLFVIKKYYTNQIDEQILLKKNTKLILPKKRINGLKKLEKEKKNLVVFDDGLQDKSIKYGLSIVCFNSLSSIGNGKLLPAGPLRENLSELKNYDAVFINGKINKNLVHKIRNKNKNIKIFYGKYYLKNKKNFNKKFKYLAFCGIGTPESFFNLLNENKIKIAKKVIYPDHYNYKISDIENIKKIADLNNYKIVTTEKDFAKIKKLKNLSIKFTVADLYINKLNTFKKFILKNI